jgi:hypothetical protein
MKMKIIEGKIMEIKKKLLTSDNIQASGVSVCCK